MKYICFYFQLHQPFRLRNYSFFDIGNDHYYYDDYLNESVMQKVAQKCYLPANKLILKLIEKHGKQFKISYSISGSALDQFELYAPEVIESFKKLANTGNVEFLSETYGHSLASQSNLELFKQQITQHSKRIEELFGQKPKVFRNTELIYSDEIGDFIYEMGFKGMLTEGAKHVLGWKSPNYLYYNSRQPKLKLLLRNFKLSDDIAFRFSNHSWNNYPLTPQKFSNWLNKINPKEELINLFMDYETFGEHQWADTGIFEFLEHLPNEILTQTQFKFETPSNIIKKLQPVAVAHVPYPISWADEERDITAWLGNDLQKEAFEKLYELTPYIQKSTDEVLLQDWQYLQNSDHFYYMSTKWFSDGEVHAYFNPYKDPYEAFINYMNILSDFSKRAKKASPIDDREIEINKLKSKILIQEQEIIRLKKQIKNRKQ
ncbi:MAG: glycoside hydrolase family 57 protein [Salinivirgaceae bacterium]|jgi:alpha-amylase|nr:glycoside hydrolase family 57 protein [Salinivirgaceae bacterium]